jgi:hypothetical protein
MKIIMQQNRGSRLIEAVNGLIPGVNGRIIFSFLPSLS